MEVGAARRAVIDVEVEVDFMVGAAVVVVGTAVVVARVDVEEDDEEVVRVEVAAVVVVREMIELDDATLAAFCCLIAFPDRTPSFLVRNFFAFNLTMGVLSID